MPLIYKTLIPILVVLGCTSVLSGVFLRNSLENTLLKEQFLKMSELTAREVGDNLSAEMFEPSRSEAHVSSYEAFAESVKDTTVARLTIWSADGTVLYSDLNSIIGIRSEGHPGVAKALQEPKPFYSRKSRDGNYPQQTSIGDFIDVYVPVRFSNSTVGVIELQSVAGAVLLPLSQELNMVVYVLLLSTLLVLAIVAFIFHRFILNPIRLVSDLARSVSRGDFSTKSIPKFNDEIGEMVSSLESMRVRLKFLVENLESEVDIRTRKLQEEEARLVASLGSLSVGLALIDSSGSIFYANDSLKKLFDLKPADSLELGTLIKRFGSDFNLKDQLDKALRQRQSSDNPTIKFESKFFRVYLAPILVQRSKKEVLGAVLLIDDVTEAKALERGKEEFLAIASHELRTPLAAIRANAALLKQIIPTSRPKKKEMLSIAADIHSATLRLLKIVHDFLDISALEQGAVNIKNESVDVTTCAQEVVEQLGGLAHEKGLSITVELPTEALAHVVGDKQRIIQVIANLVGNAINYTHEGSITISFSKSHHAVTVNIADTGAGIAAENVSLLFRKFQQAGNGVMSREITQGTGLGLYISKLILELMHGTIELVQSTKGKGSTFAITIPTSE